MLEHIKDDHLVRNVVILLLISFFVVGFTVMYVRGDLDIGYYRNSLDIAIGIAMGSVIMRTLEKK